MSFLDLSLQAAVCFLVGLILAISIQEWADDA